MGAEGRGRIADRTLEPVNLHRPPDLGPTGDVTGFLPVPGGAGAGASAHASTTVNAGPFVGIVGGLLIVAGAVLSYPIPLSREGKPPTSK